MHAAAANDDDDDGPSFSSVHCKSGPSVSPVVTSSSQIIDIQSEGLPHCSELNCKLVLLCVCLAFPGTHRTI